MWSDSEYLYIHLAGKSRPLHEKIETYLDGSTFFVVLIEPLPSRSNRNTDVPMVYNRQQKQMKKVLLTVAACFTLFGAAAQNPITPLEPEIKIRTNDLRESCIPQVLANGAYICFQNYHYDQATDYEWYSDTVNVINSNLQVERTFVVNIDNPYHHPASIEFNDLDVNTTYEYATTYYTQTLFNNDNSFEYIKPIYSTNTINYDYKIERFDILSEDGTVVNTITLEDGYLAFAVIELFKFGNKYYIVLDVANSEGREEFWYRIDQQTQSISRVENVPFKVFPTVVDRNSDITVQLEEGTNAREIVVVDALGREVKSVPVQPGQREVKVSARGLHSGLGFITDRKNNAVKIIVR